MARRLALVLGSQCVALPALSFLPDAPGPLSVGGLPQAQQLASRLRDLLVDGPGQCEPVSVAGESKPGLLLNPTKDQADAALATALRTACAQGAVLLVHFLGHGARFQVDPAAQARHLLHVWDTVATPTTGPDSFAWDPYATVGGMLPELGGMTGLVLMVDACYAAWAKQQVDAWGGVRTGLLSAWLGASGDHEAWDGCFTKTLVRLLEDGLAAADHPRRALLSELLAVDLEPVLAQRCTNQSPRLGGHQQHNVVLWIARNSQATELAASLGLDATSEALLLRLTARYVNFAVDVVASSLRDHRTIAVIGGAGTGKSTVAAAMRFAPPGADEVPLVFLHALAFASSGTGLPDLARTLRSQLDRLPAFPIAADRYRRANVDRWETLDIWQRLVMGPLTHYPETIRIGLDGLDQLDGQPGWPAVRHALNELISDPGLSHVKLLFTARPGTDLPQVDLALPMPALNIDTAKAYLASRQLVADTADQLVETAAGNWLILELAADAFEVSGSTSTTLGRLFSDVVGRAQARHGEGVDAVLAVLAAAGTGPVLPFDLLAAAVTRLGYPMSRAALHGILGDDDLYRLLDRSHAGQADDRVGLFHQALLDYVAPVRAFNSHAALSDAIEELAPAVGHTPTGYRRDPLLAYSFDAGPRHHWEAKRIDRVLAALLDRLDPLPGVNLERWRRWAAPVASAAGRDHEETFVVRANIAFWTGEAGDPAAAFRLYQQLLPISERRLGVEHPRTLTIRHNIAQLTSDTGDHAGALLLHQELLRSRLRVRGPEHPDTLATLHAIAESTAESGDVRTALRLYGKLLPVAQRSLGPEHPDTLGVLHDIAFWLGAMGDPVAALRLSEELLPIRERVQGPEHPQTLKTKENIARFLMESGEFDQALRLYQELLPLSDRVLGVEHPATLATRHNVAALVANTGDVGSALRLYEQLLPVRERIQGPDHPETLVTRHNIAQLTAELGDTGVALRLYEELLPIRERVQGPDHPDSLFTRHNIAYLTGETGNLAGALRLYQELLPIRERVLGPEHPQTLLTRHNIARFTADMGDVTTALGLHQELLPMRERVHGPEHPDTLVTRHNIARLTAETGDLPRALRLYQELLAISERLLDPEHHHMLAIRHNIAQLTAETGDILSALRVYQELLPLSERVLGSEDPQTVAIRHNIAYLTAEASDPES